MNQPISKHADNNLLKDLGSSTPNRLSCFLWLFIICLVTIFAYLPALSGNFLNFDDHRIYNQSLITDFNLENFKKIFTQQDARFHFLFNWLTLLTYQINWFVSPHYQGFVIFAIFCHLLQIIFFWKISRRLSTMLATAVLSTVLFALHPLHTHHVIWQSARWHLIAVTCCLFSAWQYLASLDENKTRNRRMLRYLLAVFGYFVIAFGRPFYFIFPLMLIVLDFLHRRKFTFLLVLNKLPFLIFAFLNLALAHHYGLMTPRIRPEWLGGSLTNTLLTDLNINLEYFRQFFIPSFTTLIVPVNQATGLLSIEGVSDLLLFKIPPVVPMVFFILLFIILIYIRLRHKARAPLILLLGIFVTLLHVQNIPARQGLAGVFAYRYAVFSVVFTAPLMALLLLGLHQKLSRAKAYSPVILCIIFGYILWNFHMTVQNVNIFKKSENLWTQHVKMLPNSRAGHYYLGKVYQYENNDPYRAISAYNKALECLHYWGARDIYPKLAQLYFEIGNWQDARRVINQIDPRTIAQSNRLKGIKAKITDHFRTESTSPRQHFPSTGNNKVILFDQVHSVRHSPLSDYTKDSIEYNVVQGYSNLQRFLQELGFTVREHRFGRLTPQILRGVDVLMIGIMSYEAMRMSEEEIDAIIDFVKRGGGLHMVCDHTNAYDNAVLANMVLKHFNIEVTDVTVVDDGAIKDSWYTPKSFAEHPVTEGLEVLVHQAGCALDTDYGVAFTGADAWADKGDPNNGIARFGNKIKESDEKTGPLPVVAARDFGKGRVVVTTDCNLYANSWIFAYDNYKLARNAFSWLAKIEPIAVPKIPHDILVHEGTAGYFRVNWNKEAYYSFYVNFGHMDSVRTYLAIDLSFDKKVIFLFDRNNPKKSKLDKLYEYVKQGGVLVYLCTEKNYKSYRTVLLNRFGIKFDVTEDEDDDVEYFAVTGDRVLCEDVFYLPWVPATRWMGAAPMVYGEFDAQRVYVAEKKVGQGAIYVVPFKRIFKTKYMGRATSSRNPNMRQQQVRRLQENLIENIVTNF